MKSIGSYILIGALFLITSNSPVFAQVKINEFVVEPKPEWVELYNASDSADYLKNYWIDDDQDFSNDDHNSTKKLLSTLNISNTAFPYFEINQYFFNDDDDWVVLFDSQGNLIDSYHYDKSPGGNISLGRNPDNTGNFYILEETTQGRANAQPVPSPSPSPSPSADPSPSPSPSPSPFPSPSPSPKLLKSPSPTPSEEPTRLDLVGEATATGEVLGEIEASPAAGTKKKNPFTLSFILIGLGLGLLTVTGVVFIKGNKYNKSR